MPTNIVTKLHIGQHTRQIKKDQSRLSIVQNIQGVTRSTQDQYRLILHVGPLVDKSVLLGI